MRDVTPENVLRTLKVILLEKVNLLPQHCLFNCELKRLASIARACYRTTAGKRPR